MYLLSVSQIESNTSEASSCQDGSCSFEVYQRNLPTGAVAAVLKKRRNVWNAATRGTTWASVENRTDNKKGERVEKIRISQKHSIETKMSDHNCTKTKPNSDHAPPALLKLTQPKFKKTRPQKIIQETIIIIIPIISLGSLDTRTKEHKIVINIKIINNLSLFGFTHESRPMKRTVILDNDTAINKSNKLL